MDFFDMLIIGGGPGGYSAAIYGARAGLSVLLLEKTVPGGQMALTERISRHSGGDRRVHAGPKSAPAGGTVRGGNPVRGGSGAAPERETDGSGNIRRAQLFRQDSGLCRGRCPQKVGTPRGNGACRERNQLLCQLRRRLLSGENGCRRGRRRIGRCRGSAPVPDCPGGFPDSPAEHPPGSKSRCGGA